MITTSPVANKYTGVFSAFFVNVSVIPVATAMVVQLKMPFVGSCRVVSVVMFIGPYAPVLPQSNALASSSELNPISAGTKKSMPRCTAEAHGFRKL
ncbi:MAG TPA: hypothetical protein VI136_09940 [Verrucomicrobiae bacterium]